MNARLSSTFPQFQIPREAWPSLLLLLVLVLLPVGRTSEAPLVVAGIAGLVLAWRARAGLARDGAIRLVAAVFLCYWLPALISAPDAVAPAKTWDTVAVALRFLPFAAFAALALRNTSALIHAAAAVVALWLLDAWVQIFTGYSFGGPMEAERITGVFGAGNPKLGPVLAVLSPFVFAAARERWGRRGLAAAFVFQLVPVLLAGSRAGWLMFALVALAFVWRETRAPLRFVAWSVFALVIAVAAAAIADRDSHAFAKRVQRTLLAFEGSEHAVDEAGAGRVRIWRTAVKMAADHPINGVGARGFRYAYPAYAGAGDTFVDPNTDEGASHAHQIVLEVASETGVVGIVFWIIGAAFAYRAWRRAGALARERARAPALALAAMTFP
ncbi:MAG TPA: O-antigen ligase family protein, partial [Rudaea sp.]